MTEHMTRAEGEAIVKALDELRSAMNTGGGEVSIGVQDPRFSKAMSAIWALLGSGVLLLLAWGIREVNDLNVKVGILISQNENRRDESAEFRRRIEALERQP